MFFKKKKNKEIQDIEHVPMGDPFGEDEGRDEDLFVNGPDDEDSGSASISDDLPEIEEDQNWKDESSAKKKGFFFGRKKKKKEEAAATKEWDDDNINTDSFEDESTDQERLEDGTDGGDKKEKKRFSLRTLSRKKKLALCLGVVIVAALGIYTIIFGLPGGSSGTKIYVEKVSDIMDLGSGTGGQNRYAGVVESQKTWNIKQNSDKTVKEIYVKEGDSVKVGDKLFAYDNDEAKLNLEQAQLELERMQNEIKSGEAEIANLEKEKKSASGSEKLEYTIQIQSQKATNKKTEYEIKSQQAKIKSLEKATKNSVVKSEMEGVVKKINQSATGSDSSSGVDDMSDSSDDSIFMSILATGDYRIKAMVNEQNKFTIEEGKAVIVHSRVDSEASWKGTISKLDTENPEESSSSDYYDSEDSSDDTTTSSKYPFYIKLDSSEGLVLGQHVYIEPDEGQDEEKEGVWLDSYYIVQDDKDSFVWAESHTKRLEKRKVTLGEYDENLDQYQITDGLAEDDYIAFPMDSLKEGMKTTRNIAEASEADTSIEGETGYEDSTEDLIPEEDFNEEDLEGISGFDEGADSLDEDLEDGQIWEGEPENEDGSVGLLDGQTEVLL